MVALGNFALGMSISCCLFPFLANENAVTGGIWALLSINIHPICTRCAFIFCFLLVCQF